MDVQFNYAGSGTVHFGPYKSEYSVPAPPVSNQRLVDILVQFWTGPSTIPATHSTGLVGVHSLQIFVGGIDISEGLVSQLNEFLAMRDERELIAEYSEGVRAYLEQASLTRKSETQNDREWFDDFLASGAYRSVDSLADASQGWSGNLGIVNYLYTRIKLPPFSIATALANAGQTEFSSLDELSDTTIRFSNGSKRPAGSIDYFATYAVHDPVPDMLRKIKRKVEGLNVSLEQQRVNYLNPMIDNHTTLESQLATGFAGQAALLEQIESLIDFSEQ